MEAKPRQRRLKCQRDESGGLLDSLSTLKEYNGPTNVIMKEERRSKQLILKHAVYFDLSFNSSPPSAKVMIPHLHQLLQP
jgi:hypothetical protein